MSAENRCTEFLDMLLKPGSPSGEFARHVKACPECAAIRAMVAEMRSKPSIYPPQAFAALQAKVIAACASSLPVKAAVAKGLSGISKLLVSAAVAGVIGTGAYFAAIRSPSGPPPGTGPGGAGSAVTQSASDAVGLSAQPGTVPVPLHAATEPSHLIHASDD